MSPTLEAEPDCARPESRPSQPEIHPPAARPELGAVGADPGLTRPLRVERRPFGTIDPATWAALVDAHPYATPFSAWAFHRAWWDAYGDNAHDNTLVVVEADPDGADRIVAILPLMDRHVVEPTDAETHTTIRHTDGPRLTPVPAAACALFFGASYHADYATLLAAPDDLARAAEAVAEALVAGEIMTGDPSDPEHAEPWSVIDLRRLRAADPAADALAAALGAHEIAAGWTLNVEREDVCPVVRLPEGADLDGFLATLGKKERHEIRRKVRRAEAAGEVRLEPSTDPLADLDAFIDLHQARWGDLGLFPDTRGGEQSRVFLRRLFELFPAGGRFSVHLGFLSVAGRRIGAEIHFETPGAVLYYNAGMDPSARELSPGVVLLERLVRLALERGKCRLDLLRGDEPYKYEWGAIDEPVQRILVRRTAAA